MTHETAAYDVDAIRADFPALSLEPYGKKLVYLDNGASAQKPRQVIERMTQASYYEYANVHRGLHYLANAATDNYEAARESVRAFLNAGSTDEIVFTKSATEAINLVASSFGREHIQAGDEIVLTILEHHANIVPWHFLRESKGAVLKWVDCDDDGVITADDVIKAITPKTKMIAVTQMSNVTGTVLPIKAIVAAAHAQRHPGARRRFAGRGASRTRHAGPRRRLLRDDRPQALRADRHRRALREEALARKACRPSSAAAR